MSVNGIALAVIVAGIILEAIWRRWKRDRLD